MNQSTKNKLSRILFYSTVILRPAFWALSAPYNRNIDNFIQDILDRNVEGEYTGTYTVRYGDVAVWIGTYPYSYTNLRDTPIVGRASRYNIYRFKKYIDGLEKRRYNSYMNGMTEKEYLSLERIAKDMFIRDN
jgi:hypothetical protein